MTFIGQETHPMCEPSPTEELARQFVDAIQREDEPEITRLEKLLNQPTLPKLGATALWYAKRGWAVFPLSPNGKQPLLSRHEGGSGLYDATTDLKCIKGWWDRYPEANIGLPTGNQFDVIDIDGPPGMASLASLTPDKLPDIHGKVASPHGFHLYVEATGDGNRAGVLPGIDYRGKGGYVCAPPSQLDLKRWQWLIKPSPAILKEAA